MSWQEHYRRHSIIEAVLTEVAWSGRPIIPVRWEREIAEVFGGNDAFLAAVHYRWLNTLTARLDAALEDSTADLRADVQRVRENLVNERPTLWRLLAAHADRRGLVHARKAEQQRCGWAEIHPTWWVDTVPAAYAA